MRVIALVGKTGTGKSYQCIELAREENIESIIDDGLLISGNKILAGKSAKHETTKMASVKRAIFANDQFSIYTYPGYLRKDGQVYYRKAFIATHRKGGLYK